MSTVYDEQGRHRDSVSAKHTAGPWRIHDMPLPARGLIEVGPAILRQPDRLTKHYALDELPEMKANAHLIASAPELLEALEALMPWIAKGIERRIRIFSDALETLDAFAERVAMLFKSGPKTRYRDTSLSMF